MPLVHPVIKLWLFLINRENIAPGVGAQGARLAAIVSWLDPHGHASPAAACCNEVAEKSPGR